MALETYRAKRDFRKTAEPRGRKARAAGGTFVVQKHAARRLHYDLRLELDGVLKSWAVTRGPSLVPGEKRLAVEVEDHPLEYGDFEGTIPKGEYGGGSVIVWDRGRWRPESDPHRGFAKGHLDFALDGEKLSGRWHLVRLKGKPREKRTNWLLIKSKDEAARSEADPDVLVERPESVRSGRTVEQVEAGVKPRRGRAARAAKPKAAARATRQPAKAAAAADIPGARKERMPAFVEPCLATLRPKAPSGAGWVHEIKFDGYRLQAAIDGGKVTLRTRAGLDWTRRFGRGVRDALARLAAKKAIIDGELVVETGSGASDFSALQADLGDGRHDRFRLYLFDLLHLDGMDLRPATLADRKAALRALLADAPADGVIRYSEDFADDGATVLKHACRLSLEGVVSKRRDAPYRSGRGADWIKSKCSERQEFVIAGYVPSTTSARAIGSLVLGVHEKGRLVHVGRVGTGFTRKVAADLWKRLDKRRVERSPFAGRLAADQARDVRFIEPVEVAEVEFRGWTDDRNLRHASFRGLREDKPAKEIVRETAARPSRAGSASSIRLTHPDRVYWPDAGITKQGLADYYAEVWRRIAPFIVARPLALVRCPEGIVKQCFFQKHAWRGMNASIRQDADPADPKGEPLLTIRDLDGLTALVQSGVLEIHPWGATIDAIETPDYINFDLDPGDGVDWPGVIAAAHEVRRRLEDRGLAAFVKTSGGKGLHVVAPLKPKAEWPAVKAFARAIADQMAKDDPARFLATATKAKRRGRIFVDYLRNGRGATAIAPYSTRARPGAAVSMPLAWDELTPAIGPAYFTVANAPTRLAGLDRDPWEDFRKAAVPLPSATARTRTRRR